MIAAAAACAGPATREHPGFSPCCSQMVEVGPGPGAGSGLQPEVDRCWERGCVRGPLGFVSGPHPGRPAAGSTRTHQGLLRRRRVMAQGCTPRGWPRRPLAAPLNLQCALYNNSCRLANVSSGHVSPYRPLAESSRQARPGLSILSGQGEGVSSPGLPANRLQHRLLLVGVVFAVDSRGHSQ